MRAEFNVLVSEQTGLPYIQVQPEVIWGLVEYLSWQRIRVSYTYESCSFIVHFLQSDCATAQKILDDWNVPQDVPQASRSDAAQKTDWMVGKLQSHHDSGW